MNGRHRCIVRFLHLAVALPSVAGVLKPVLIKVAHRNVDAEGSSKEVLGLASKTRGQDVDLGPHGKSRPRSNAYTTPERSREDRARAVLHSRSTKERVPEHLQPRA